MRSIAVFLLTVAVYAAGLVLPICTQRAVDMIANGTAGRQLVWLGTGATAAVGIEAALTSLRQSLVMRLISFLDRRISRKAFLHLMRMRIDLGVFPAGDVLGSSKLTRSRNSCWSWCYGLSSTLATRSCRYCSCSTTTP